MSNVETRQLFMGGFLAMNEITWPNQIEFLYCNAVQFPISSGWPDLLDTLVVDSPMECMPFLPNSLSHLYLGIWWEGRCMPNWPTSLPHYSLAGAIITEEQAIYCSVLNSTCPGSYPGIAGHVFRDLNGNGSFDPNEPGLHQATVTLQPNGNMVSCTTDGTWEIGVAPGSYTITAASSYPYIQSIAPASHAADVPNMGDTDTDNDFAVTLTPDIQDLRTYVYADPARPGFENQMYLRCENYGTTEVDATLTLTFDADQSWLGSSVSPASQTGNAATWSFPAMPIGSVQQIVVDLNTAANVPLGTSIVHTVIADPVASDETPLDNTATYTDSVVGSYDPNDKLLNPARLTPDEVAAGVTPIEYTIRFQNTGTYQAERVVILDTLSNDLQWESMTFVASSHDQHWYITDGVLHVIHNDINLPDSTADEPGSHGFFTFRMLPKTNLGDGSVITNIAHIVFDFNEPIITPPAVFTVDVEAAVSEVQGTRTMLLSPNPAHDRIQVRKAAAGTALYMITDILGRTRSTGLLQPDGWIDIGSLTDAVYFLEVADGPQRRVERFVKN
ncbi:MAG: T9SS type A sorting domain-containing protein [Flavobacteriales bacterium]|nr:T9SS type A sorting domain-containing protein [Flavobacteriales bacterium]